MGSWQDMPPVGFQEDALGPCVTTGHVGSTHRAHQSGLRAGLRGAVLVGAAATRYHRLGGLLTLDLREKAKKPGWLINDRNVFLEALEV